MRRSVPTLLFLPGRNVAGPPMTAAPRVGGSGTKLIERAILDATVHRDFRAEGLVCTVKMALPG
jgi:two-component sensor histidine kinase